MTTISISTTTTGTDDKYYFTTLQTTRQMRIILLNDKLLERNWRDEIYFTYTINY